MAQPPFIYTNPEAAKQAIAERQLQAALAENQSRENIAREQTQAARYATQSQISENEKDRQVRREANAAYTGYRSGAETDRLARERGDIQYQTVLGKLNIADPLTKSELEAALADSPSLTDDQRKQLRSIRDEAYKQAKFNATNGDQVSKNYRSELDALAKAKVPDVRARDDLYKRLRADKDVFFDAATGGVTSRHKMPREDVAAPTASTIGTTGVGVSPAQDYGGARQTSAVPAGAIPTIEDLKKKITGGIGYAQPVPTTSAVRSSDITSTGSGSPVAGIGRAVAENIKFDPAAGITFPNLSLDSFLGPAAPRDPMQGPMERFRQPGGFGMRVSDIAPPPQVSIPAPQFALPRPIQSFDMPQFQSPVDNREALINMTRDPRFPTLPFEHQQWILDEIGNSTPRAFDMQTIRPEYRPPLDDYESPTRRSPTPGWIQPTPAPGWVP